MRVVFNLKIKLPASAATESPPQHPAEEPDEYSDAESSSSPASPPEESPPVVSNIAGYNLDQYKIIYVSDVQRRELAIRAQNEEETASDRSWHRVTRPQQFEDLLNSFVY